MPREQGDRGTDPRQLRRLPPRGAGAETGSAGRRAECSTPRRTGTPRSSRSSNATRTCLLTSLMPRWFCSRTRYGWKTCCPSIAGGSRRIAHAPDTESGWCSTTDSDAPLHVGCCELPNRACDPVRNLGSTGTLRHCRTIWFRNTEPDVARPANHLGAGGQISGGILTSAEAGGGLVEPPRSRRPDERTKGGEWSGRPPPLAYMSLSPIREEPSATVFRCAIADQGADVLRHGLVGAATSRIRHGCHHRSERGRGRMRDAACSRSRNSPTLARTIRYCAGVQLPRNASR